jgi:ribose transport system permease protein
MTEIIDESRPSFTHVRSWSYSVQQIVRRIPPPLLALTLAVLLFILGGIVRPGFTNAEQAISILRLAAILAFISAGQTLVIISGEEGIDLSIGAVVTLSAILTFRIASGQNEMLLPGFLVALGVGAGIGFINGVGITLLGVPPLVMTLSMAGVVAGSIRAVTFGQFEGGTPPLLRDVISAPLVAGIPGIVILWILFGVGIWLLLERTTYGKHLFAVGVNRRAAMLSGVRVKWIVVITFTISGLLAALAGIVFLGHTQTVFLNLGENKLFPSIAAVVVGGTALSGGRGSYWGTMAGALVLQLIESLLQALNIAQAYQWIILGLMLIVITSIYGRERRLRQ